MSETETNLGPHTLISVRMPNTLFGLLKKISDSTGLSVSELIRRACTKYLLTAPEDLPLNLKAAITRLDIQTTISLIKDIRYCYHKLREADKQLARLQHNNLPAHTINILAQLETDIQNKVKKLDQWLATHQTRLTDCLSC